MASNQGRRDLELPLRRGQGEMNTVKSVAHRRWLQRRFALQTVGQQTRPRHVEEALAIGIIEVENMPHGWQVLEETRFCGKVSLCSAMIIVMVAAEVGKHGRFEAAAPHSLLVQ